MGIIIFYKMPGLYLLQLFDTKEHCKIQSNNLKDAHIGGNYIDDNSHSGENFCGNAGDTTGHSKYLNKVTSKATSKATSKSSSGGGSTTPPASKPSTPPSTGGSSKVCGGGWG